MNKRQANRVEPHQRPRVRYGYYGFQSGVITGMVGSRQVDSDMDRKSDKRVKYPLFRVEYDDPKRADEWVTYLLLKLIP